MKHAIEEDFPIVEINRLAVPERSAFKPHHRPDARRKRGVSFSALHRDQQRALLLSPFG